MEAKVREVLIEIVQKAPRRKGGELEQYSDGERGRWWSS